jgi:hypothetical protein
MIAKSLLIWVSIIPLTILNGLLREKVIIPLISMEYGLLISAVLLCLLIFIVCLIFIPKIGKGIAKDYWIMGLLWLLLTIAFETIFGLLQGNTFAELINAYDIRTGNFWLLVVLFTGIAPWLAAKTRKLI